MKYETTSSWVFFTTWFSTSLLYSMKNPVENQGQGTWYWSQLFEVLYLIIQDV